MVKDDRLFTTRVAVGGQKSSQALQIDFCPPTGRFVAPAGGCVVAITCQDHRKGSRRRPNRFDTRQKSSHVGDQMSSGTGSRR
jgi:hypothetical protein